MNWLLFFSIVLFYLILVLVNLPVTMLGIELDSEPKPRSWYQPSGFVISTIWFILFTLLGIARYHLIITENEGQVWWLFALAALSASYAYYTLGLARLTGIAAPRLALVGNLIVLAFATLVFYKLSMVSATAAFLVVPVVVWAAYAGLVAIGELRTKE